MDPATLKRSLPVAAALQWLGIEHRRDGRRYVFACPAHADRTPSCVGEDKGGVALYHCYACQWGGSTIDLVAAVSGRSIGEAMREIADRVGMTEAPSVARASAARPKTPPPDRPYPPRHDVAALWESAGYVSDDPDVAAWLRSRAIDPLAIDCARGTARTRGSARALPTSAALPRWARHGGEEWTTTGHRLLVAMYDAAGELRSVRARAVTPDASPKCLPPSGYRASGLVAANALAMMMLQLGAWPQWAERRLVIVEGEPDFLTWSAKADADRNLAVIGIGSGAWTAAHAARVPTDTTVIIRTDNDEAGDRYAAATGATLAPRCRVLRGGVRDATERTS